MITVAVDWGSTSFRAYRFNNNRVEDTLESEFGIKSLPHGSNCDAFPTILNSQLGDWLKPGDGILLAGMITSNAGWVETPYISCPVECANIAEGLTPLQINHNRLYFVPGISQTQPCADVMRGEEVQLLGLLENETTNTEKARLVVLPGTHSKWASLKQRTVQRFKTIPTGELYSALTQHTLIGQLGEIGSWCEQSFGKGVSLGFTNSNTIGNLFTARSSVLLKKMHRNQVQAWLSGLLIGSEIREGMQISVGKLNQVTLVGAKSLTEKYLNAFSLLGLSADVAESGNNYPDITAAGFAAIIKQLHRNG